MVNTLHNFMETKRIQTSSFCIAIIALQPLVDPQAHSDSFHINQPVQPVRLVNFSHFQKVNKNQNIKNLYQIRGIFVPLRMERRLFEPQSVMMSLTPHVVEDRRRVQQGEALAVVLPQARFLTRTRRRG